MKFALLTLGLFLVSAFAVETNPKLIQFQEDYTYIYEYSGHVLTGIPEVSSLYSGSQLNATVELVVVKSDRRDDTDGRNIIRMTLSQIVLGKTVDEVTDVAQVNFDREQSDETVFEILRRPVQFYFDDETNSFEWVEVRKDDKPWSLNIKKSIIDMLQLNIVGAKVEPEGFKLVPGLRAFDIYESTIKGVCETNYQINPTSDVNKMRRTLPGGEKFDFTVTKTRNFANCFTSSKLDSHNWDKRGCVEYCSRFTREHLNMDGINKHVPLSEETEPNCACDLKETQPVDQFSTTQYNVTLVDGIPTLERAHGKGKLVIDNHGTKVVVYTQHYLTLIDSQNVPGQQLIPVEDVIRVNDLVFSLYPYRGMVKTEKTHIFPFYNLIVPSPEHPSPAYALGDLLREVAQVVVKQGTDLHSKAAWYMVQIIHCMNHATTEELERIYSSNCRVNDDERYTNSENAVTRQLFLDALAHVGTKASAEFLRLVLTSSRFSKLSKLETRQFVETLPQNVYAPSAYLLETLRDQVTKYHGAQAWDELAAFAVPYGKLISKACRFPVETKDEEIEIDSRYMKLRPNKVLSTNSYTAPIDYPEEQERCTREAAVRYINDLVELLKRSKDIKGKVIIAQALAHSGQLSALKYLRPFITGAFESSEFECTSYVNGSSTSDCAFLRSSVIYSLHHMIPVSPKLLRSLVLPVFQNKFEPYELRLAAFTVLMAAGPKRHELESVAATLRGETNRQVITMVRSILEETANLTQACHLPVAQAAREIIPTLPQFNLDGYYSQASYNEWYSEEKSTGFFANSQYIVNNMSYIPRHGYLSLGSHWKSLTNSWLTIAYQQKGLEPILMKKLEKIFSPDWFIGALLKTDRSSGKPVDDLFTELDITQRSEEDAKVKLFVKLFEQTSLFTFDTWSIEAAYNQFSRAVNEFVLKVNAKKSFNYVRFFMPSSYINVVPSDIGLPIVISKDRRQIVAVRFEQGSLLIDSKSKLSKLQFEAKLTPQVYYSSTMSVSAFQQGLAKNYGTYSLKKTTLYAPVDVVFKYESVGRSLVYSVKPQFDTKFFHASNKNRVFVAKNYIGLPINESPFIQKADIKSWVPGYTASPKLQSRDLGMDLEVEYFTERPWFYDVEKIASKGPVTWLIEKYAELNNFNYNVELTLKKNSANPTEGIEGSLNYNFVFSGDVRTIDQSTRMDRYVADDDMTLNRVSRSNRLAPEASTISNDEIKRTAEQMVVKYPNKFVPKKTGLTATLTRALVLSTRILAEKPTNYNATFYFIQAVDYSAFWVKFVSQLERPDNYWFDIPRLFQVEAILNRPPLLSELAWDVKSSYKGQYIADLSWTTKDVPTLDRKIRISGDLLRTVDDEVVGNSLNDKKWYEGQCRRDSNDLNSMSYACQLDAYEKLYFNKITGSVSLPKNLEINLVNATEQAYSFAKLYLTSFWRPWSTIRSYPQFNPKQYITFEAKHSRAIAGRPVVNFEIKTPSETSLFYKLFFPINRFPGFHPTMFMKASILPKDRVCSLMNKHVRTFDNVTFEKPRTECEYVLAMDCSENRQFAVTIQESVTNTKDIRVLKVLVGKQTIKVNSVTQTVANLEINNKQINVVPTQSYILTRDLAISSIRIHLQNDYLVIELPHEHVRVVFNGELAKVTTSPIYTGKTCGICGNQDQEADMELQGPTNCIYDLVEDFQNAYSLGECRRNEVKGNPRCPGSRYNRRNYIEGDWEPLLRKQKLVSKKGELKSEIEKEGLRSNKIWEPTLRTLVFRDIESGKTCFSKFPVLTCDAEDETDGITRKGRIPIVCFPKSHPIYEKYIDEAEGRVLDFSNYPLARYLTLDIPVYCASKGTSARGI